MPHEISQVPSLFVYDSKAVREEVRGESHADRSNYCHEEVVRMCILHLLTSRRVSRGSEAGSSQAGAKSTEEGTAIDKT